MTISDLKTRRGSALVEFVLVALLLAMMLFSTIEFERMLLVYTTVANSARAGVRYAIVHGSSRLAGCNGGVSTTTCNATNCGPVDCPSSSSNTAQVQTVVKNFAGMGLLDTSKLTINVNYPDTNNDPGDRVQVTVKYTYDPFSIWFSPLIATLPSTTEGVITY